MLKSGNYSQRRLGKVAREVIICGGCGYLGWPLAQHFSEQGCNVTLIDNQIKLEISSNIGIAPLISVDFEDKILNWNHGHNKINYINIDVRDRPALIELFSKTRPSTVVHLAEQPSAPYSMIGFDEAKFTIDNNLQSTHVLLSALLEVCPEAHLIKLGTMGEYGTPNIDIEEGWLEVEHNGRRDKFLYPRQASSLYHTTKILDTDLIWFYVRNNSLKVTDLMQGPVYGCSLEDKCDDYLSTVFWYDQVFGTVVNRFATQAALETPLSVFGSGGQRRGFIHLRDSIKCISLAAANPPKPGEFDIYNQFTEVFSVIEIAEIFVQAAQEMGLKCSIEKVKNPRKEMEKHYYNPKIEKFRELGLVHSRLDLDCAKQLINYVLPHANNVDMNTISKTISW